MISRRWINVIVVALTINFGLQAWWAYSSFSGGDDARGWVLVVCAVMTMLAIALWLKNRKYT